MSAATKTYAILTCDNCGATLDTKETGAIGTTGLRIAASEIGWHYAQVMIPYPPGHQGHRESARRQFDFCTECGIPDRITTELTACFRTGLSYPVLQNRTVPVTLLSGVAVYGKSEDSQ